VRQGQRRVELDTTRIFQQTLFDMQTRWGQQIIRRATDEVAHGCISTGITALDAILSTQGIARGQTTALMATGTSGMTTLSYQVAASAQRETQLPVIYFDLEESFDAYYASNLGIELDQLLVVRPSTLLRAIDIAADLIKVANIALVILDPGVQARPFAPSEIQSRLQNLSRLVRRSPSAFVCLLNTTLPAAQPIFVAQSQFCLNVHRRQWLRDPLDQHNIIGCETQVTVTKDHGQPNGKAANFPIYFSGVHPGE
jgi:RecA/RadA recombinase